MSEIGDVSEIAKELVLEAGKEDARGKIKPTWHNHVALSTLVFALLISISALLSGTTTQQVILERTKEIIDISILEGDKTEGEVLKAKHELLQAMGEIPDEEETDKIQAFNNEISELQSEAARREALVSTSLYAHFIYLVAIALLSTGITVSGMAIIVEKKLLWHAGMAFGIAGAICLVYGIIMMLR